MQKTGVILAAGRGSRINPLSAIIPKPLLPVCNKPIMQYQVEALRDADVTDLVIVVGAPNGPIEHYFGNGDRFGMRITYVVDDQPQGIASSLARAEPYVGDACAVFLGDIFLEIGNLKPALASMEELHLGGVVLVKHEPHPDAIRRNFAVLMDEQGWVTKVIEKPKELPNDLKGCGVYLFSRAIFDAIRRTPRSALRNEYELTDAIQMLIDAGERVRASATVHWDINVTFPVDLLNANLFYLKEQGLRMLVGENTRIAPGTTLSDAIIGDEVHIHHPLKIAESVIFPGVNLEDRREPLEHALVLPGVCLNVA
jgi:dTDP-glucose pyrophosphorylase